MAYILSAADGVGIAPPTLTDAEVKQQQRIEHVVDIMRNNAPPQVPPPVGYDPSRPSTGVINRTIDALHAFTDESAKDARKALTNANLVQQMQDAGPNG